MPLREVPTPVNLKAPSLPPVEEVKTRNWHYHPCPQRSRRIFTKRGRRRAAAGTRPCFLGRCMARAVSKRVSQPASLRIWKTHSRLGHTDSRGTEYSRCCMAWSPDSSHQYSSRRSLCDYHEGCEWSFHSGILVVAMWVLSYVSTVSEIGIIDIYIYI